MNFREWVDGQLAARGMKLDDLMARTGISPSRFYRSRDRASLQPHHLVKVFEALGIPDEQWADALREIAGPDPAGGRF